MKARVTWAGDMMFVGEGGSGHAIVMDGAPDAGGRNMGLRPMEMLLVGMGGCTAFDVVLILKRGREPVTDCIVELDAERAETDPKVFTRIHVKYLVTGKALDPRKVERAVQLSAEKYCSASIMMGQTATITHEVVVQEA
jgi:putative redox protein